MPPYNLRWRLYFWICKTMFETKIFLMLNTFTIFDMYHRFWVLREKLIFGRHFLRWRPKYFGHSLGLGGFLFPTYLLTCVPSVMLVARKAISLQYFELTYRSIEVDHRFVRLCYMAEGAIDHLYDFKLQFSCKNLPTLCCILHCFTA